MTAHTACWLQNCAEEHPLTAAFEESQVKSHMLEYAAATEKRRCVKQFVSHNTSHRLTWEHNTHTTESSDAIMDGTIVCEIGDEMKLRMDDITYQLLDEALCRRASIDRIEESAVNPKC